MTDLPVDYIKGFSPPASRRNISEPLDSYCSCQSPYYRLSVTLSTELQFLKEYLCVNV
ncbi:MAG: hypothetical protein FWG98_01650 [Candidatus Cloacimonetes bacterium]|nr:hypothetical protein [Candidatus Cloacimonadota bacterium]